MTAFLNPTGEWKQLKTEEAVLIEYKIQEVHDEVNDQHISYYVYKLTNLTNEVVTVDFEYEYTTNGEVRKSTKDDFTHVTIPANGSIEGDFEDNRSLTMFHKFLPGNSGKVAAEVTYENVELNITQKK